MKHLPKEVGIARWTWVGGLHPWAMSELSLYNRVEVEDSACSHSSICRMEGLL